MNLLRVAKAARALGKDKTTAVGFLIVFCLMLVAIFAPYIAPYSEDTGKVAHLSQALRPPSWEHLFGTDDVGRDIFSRVLFGTRLSLQVGVMVVVVSLIIGIALGLSAGYFGGWIEMAIMRLTDIFVSVPRLILPVAFAGVLGPSLRNAMLALIITWWPWYVRLLVSEIKSVKEKEYIKAAEALGASAVRIMFRHILPNSVTALVVQGTLDIGWAIMMCATLGFIGIGAQPPTPEWGVMVARGRAYMPDFWWWSTFPGLFIFIAVMGFNMLGDGLRDLLDPRTRSRVG